VQTWEPLLDQISRSYCIALISQILDGKLVHSFHYIICHCIYESFARFQTSRVTVVTRSS
jgi:hypothetical protein